MAADKDQAAPDPEGTSVSASGIGATESLDEAQVQTKAPTFPTAAAMPA